MDLTQSTLGPPFVPNYAQLCKGYGASASRRNRVKHFGTMMNVYCALLVLVAPIGSYAQPPAVPEVPTAYASINFTDDRTMRVKFSFSEPNRPKYTLVNTSTKETHRDPESNPPHLFGELSREPGKKELLIGLSGGQNSSATLEVLTSAQPEDNSNRFFEIEFLRFSEIGAKDLALAAIAYGEVHRVDIEVPSWGSDIVVSEPTKDAVAKHVRSVSIDLTKGGLLQFEVVGLQGTWPRFVTGLVIDNIIWFVGTLILGSMISFLLPIGTHRTARVILGLIATAAATWLLSQIGADRELWAYVKTYAPFYAAELGLIICIVFFDRLEGLVQRLVVK